jgi:hypothetical protein
VAAGGRGAVVLVHVRSGELVRRQILDLDRAVTATDACDVISPPASMRIGAALPRGSIECRPRRAWLSPSCYPGWRKP